MNMLFIFFFMVRYFTYWRILSIPEWIFWVDPVLNYEPSAQIYTSDGYLSGSNRVLNVIRRTVLDPSANGAFQISWWRISSFLHEAKTFAVSEMGTLRIRCAYATAVVSCSRLFCNIVAIKVTVVSPHNEPIASTLKVVSSGKRQCRQENRGT